jgi:hypothetical protein
MDAKGLSVAVLRQRNLFLNKIDSLEKRLNEIKQQYNDDEILKDIDNIVKCCSNCGKTASEAISFKQKESVIRGETEPKSSDYSEIDDAPHELLRDKYRGVWRVTVTKISCKNCGNKWEL